MRIVATGFNRHIYAEMSMASWSRARGIHFVPVTVFVDHSDVASLVEFGLKTGLPSAEVVHNPVRFGVLENPYRALVRGFEAEASRTPGGLGLPDDFVILAEDDVVVSSDALEFFTWASDTFGEDRSVLGVCAFSRWRPGPIDQGLDGVADPTRVSVRADFCPLVWGTWRDRWETRIGPTWDRDYTSGPIPGHQQGWDWNLRLRVMRPGEGFVFPEVSRSDHIGRVGGTHMREADFPTSQALTFTREHPVTRYRVRG